MKKKEYNRQLRELQVEVVRMQRWVKQTGKRVVIVFEGRDTAGKGSMIRALTARASARVFKVVALPAPSDRQLTQLYLQRYIEVMPAAGEVVLFDRSWYNRAGVEPVMGFCTEEQTRQFLDNAPTFERWLIDDGIILLKYWLEVGEEEQKNRLQERLEDPVKRWKFSDMDIESRRRWYAYSRARDRMLEATDIDESPWHIVPSDDQRVARLNCIQHLLQQIPYATIEHPAITLPDRDLTDQYDDAAAISDRRVIPQTY
ncbi:MAG: polyphosphate kinase 2 [Gammaproteobacteria bacterium]|nr:polyphosphate kinase 2 [Gammaproteobacteria bacterium]NND53946.1 polyphosphate kinase 2 [Gammaproteobacteria bacterium]